MNRTIAVRNSDKGFTLVELAIVMIIIGLLIGGILKGQELIANARVASTVAQIKGIDAATTTFRDKYDSMPGDMPNAAQRLVNCTVAPCATGAAGGLVGDGRVNTTNFAAAPGNENQAFWAHLAAADLLNGIDPAQGAIWGGIYPQAEIGGGYHVAYVAALADMTGALTVPAASLRSGHYLALHNAPGAAVPATGVVTPNQAFRIDNKLDDGSPGSGTVYNGGAATCTVVIAGAPAYDQNNEIEVCNVFIRFQQ